VRSREEEEKLNYPHAELGITYEEIERLKDPK